jgi:guanylate kinase
MEVKKNIIVLAGPSGVGKSTLTHILLNYSDSFEFSISATTRAIRIGEKNGSDYYFFSEEEFKKRIENGDFLEWEEVYPGRFYGTLKTEANRITGLGRIAVFDIDVLGGVNIKKQFPETSCTIFVKPESTEALEKRLVSRGTENAEQIQTRINRFEKELSYEDKFDIILVNRTGDIESAKQELITIVEKNCL